MEVELSFVTDSIDDDNISTLCCDTRNVFFGFDFVCRQLSSMTSALVAMLSDVNFSFTHSIVVKTNLLAVIVQ